MTDTAAHLDNYRAGAGVDEGVAGMRPDYWAHQVPLGGENLNAYVGAPRLVRTNGAVTIHTVSGGGHVVEQPDAGEIVWCDDSGFTCRRWNLLQGRRAQLTRANAAAVFILDALEPTIHDALTASGDELVIHLGQLGDNVRATRRVTTSPTGQEHL